MSNSITSDIVYQLRGAADPSISPDGRRLAYTRSWVDRGNGIESKSRIVMMNLDDGSSREFTQGNRDSVAMFSPDGKTLAFLRSDDKRGREVWVMDADGGEARPLDGAPGKVFEFAWSPDSKHLVISADVDPDATSLEGSSNSVPQVTVVERVRYRYDTLGWRGNAHAHLFVADLAGGPVRQITDGDWDDSSPRWSPDGSRIAFISGRREDRDFWALTEIYVVPADGGEPVLRSEGLQGSGGVAWSPDGRRLAVIGTEDPDGLVAWQGWLYVLEPGTAPRRLTDDSIKPLLSFPSVNQPPEMRWTEDERILFLGDRCGESYLFEAQADGGAVRTVTGGESQTSAVTLVKNAERAAVLSSSPASPVDLHLVTVDSGESAQLTWLNGTYLAEHSPATLEKFSFHRAGFDIECRLLFPPDFNPDRQYPLLLDIHGGPNGAFYDSFVPVQQVLAAAGYLVLAVNPRGSSTYGNDFMKAVLTDWGGEDYLDLIAAVDLVAERPYVDGGRLGIHGYSYGGFMTTWTIGHNHRFKAAVAGAPCIDLYSMYGTSDIGISFGEAQWGGSLVNAADKLIKRSPITYAENVATPVLLLHGESDHRCPIAQSEEYFTVLKRLGKEVEFVRFPGCSHAFPRTGHPKMREEYLARTLAWFDKHLAE